MAGTNTKVVDCELTFTPDATAQHSYAYFPDVIRGHYVELIVYIYFSHGSSAGKIQIQTAYDKWSKNSDTWANVGNTIDWAAEDSWKYAAVTGVFGTMRLDINTAVTSGTVRAFIIAVAGA